MKKDKGFTLVELMVVMLVLSLGLTTLVLMLRQATFNNTSAQFLTVAQGLAQEKMEQIISDRKTQGFSYIDNSNYSAETPVTGYSTYSRSVNIFYVDSTDLNTQAAGPTNYKRAIVTVIGPGAGANVTLVTLVANS